MLAFVGLEWQLMRQAGSWDGLASFDGYVGLIDDVDPDVPEHLPDDVHTAYKEALICVRAGCPNAAGAMLRLSLDLTTKKVLEEVQGSLSHDAVPPIVQDRLANRIQWLIEHRHIPQRLKGLADEVRLSGNDGAHDGSLTMDDALELLDFTEVVLLEIYTAAGKLAVAAARRKTRRAGA
ncbi:DUF4145 domain-containing protein [Achromobacter marplatensis]|uniref:DUF4145 domain-containing protein n=1 Tax=Achromobacter marplatensis TaxID=470868 RepID=UPI0002780D9C|nr:DUF4145 domain-containing protein [Achromobacter marplatensis]EJO31716.1 hypothetical protein QWC_10109 [Achromobacter marplatensis]